MSRRELSRSDLEKTKRGLNEAMDWLGENGNYVETEDDIDKLRDAFEVLDFIERNMDE